MPIEPGLRFSHIGIPTDCSDMVWIYLKEFRARISDFRESPYAAEWLYFHDDSSVPEDIQEQAHVAYECDDLEEALKDKYVLMPPFEPFPGFRCAFLKSAGVVVELIQRVEPPANG
ncbi:MAG: hypothetical protein ACOX0A_06825 [Thermoguttaceae bacterium]|jgi:hypothetical protein